MEPVIEIASEPIVLDSHKYFLAYSSGKDSTLCKWLLNEAGIDNISLYKVSYDNDKHSDDGHIECQILDQFIYSQLSVSGIKSNSDIISASQADDIHVTFMAPYCKLANGMPGNLVVGLPWDVIHSLDNGLGELVPTETYKSIKMLEELFLSLNILGFKVLSPIASLHTYAVYNVLQKIIGIEQLMQLESCWDAYLFDGLACGTCPKCQRLKFIFKECFKIDYIPWAPTLNISSADFLFSSIYALHATNRYPHIDFKSTCIIDNESKDFSDKFIDLLCTKFNLSFVKEDIIIPFIPDSQVWSDITNQIIDFIEIDYSKLNSCRIHTFDVPYLPFEGYYNWGRTTKVLSCYASISFYNSRFQRWELVHIAKNGPELIIPDLEIFRKWLDLDNIKINYPNVYILYERKTVITSI